MAVWLFQERHPSALEMFDDLMGLAAGKQIAVFLDYDGTLSPIVEDPDKAYMSDEASVSTQIVHLELQSSPWVL